jgi:hypothetical protein
MKTVEKAPPEYRVLTNFQSSNLTIPWANIGRYLMIDFVDLALVAPVNAHLRS